MFDKVIAYLEEAWKEYVEVHSKYSGANYWM